MTPRLAAALMEIVVTDGDVRDAILGDMEEDAAVVAASRGVREARRWYRRQLATSIPPLAIDALMRARASSWLLVFAAALGAYAGMIVMVLSANLAFGAWSGTAAAPMDGATVSSFVQSVLGAVAGGYFAAWIRRRAPYASAIALGVLLLVLSLVSLAHNADRVPAWYNLTAAMLMLPAAVCGAGLRVHRRMSDFKPPARRAR